MKETSNLERDMRIVKLKGGLGNQMFQYSYALLVEKRTGEPVKLDYSSYYSLGSDSVRVPRIEKFDIHIGPADQRELSSILKFSHKGNSLSFKYKVGILAEEKLNHRYFREPNRGYIDPTVLMGYYYFDGYWQSWRYVEEVKEKVKKEFVPNYNLSEKTRITQDVMRSENAVFIGVRRGDYAAEREHYGSFNSNYYLNAMSYISQRVNNPVFYVFSNDIDWCKANLHLGDYCVKYRDSELQTDDFEELMLMASCQHAIIVNSSYHWWGATLIKNSKKIICCPEKWWFDDKPIDIIPNEWIRIKQ